MKRERVQRPRRKPDPGDLTTEQRKARAAKAALKDDLDDLLDDIDAVLEENAEEFVKAYVQKGGE